MTQGTSNRNCALLLVVCSTAWACNIDSDCEFGNCIRGWYSNQCGKPSNSLDGGEACAASAECKSGNCLNRVFATDRCSYEKHTKKSGQSCDTDEECKSNKCFEGYFFASCTSNVTSLKKGADCYADSECASRKCYHKSLLTWECTSHLNQSGGKPCDVDSECKSRTCSQSMLFGDKCQHELNILDDNAVCQEDNECKSKKCEIEKFWHTQGTCQSTPLGGNQSLSRNAYEAPVPIGAKRCSKHTDCTISKECIWPMGGVFGWVAEGYCRRADKTQATGKLCSMDEECAGGNCRSEYLTSVCAPPKGSVQAEKDCYSHSDCASTRCLGWSVHTKGKCAKMNLAVDASCTYAFQCKSQLCPEAKCVANRTALQGKKCDNHVECASGYCIGLWRPWGGKCDNSNTGAVGGKSCNRDAACISGLCNSDGFFSSLKFGFFDAGRCSAAKNSQEVGDKCKLDLVCKSKYCIKGSMTAITGQVCGNPRGSVPEKSPCKTDTECKNDYLCSGKYLKSGKCVKANSTYTYKTKRSFNKVLSFPGRALGGTKSVVSRYITAWRASPENKATVDKENVGVVNTTEGKKDLIDNPFEIWIYDHLVMVVISIVAEMASRIEATGFGGELESLVEGVMNLEGTPMPTGGEAGQRMFRGSTETMEWLDDLMDNENWYFNTNVSQSNYISFMQPLIPHRLIRSMIRMAMGMGVGFLESTLKSAEARIFGRWMKNAKAASKSRRLAYAENRTGFNSSNTTVEKAEKENKAAEKGLTPQNDAYISTIASSWSAKAGKAFKAGYKIVGRVGSSLYSGAKYTVNHDWTQSLIKNMIGCMLMATHRMLSVGLELPFIFDEHLRLRRTDEDREVSAEEANFVPHVTAEVCKKQPTKPGCDEFKQEKPADGYGSMPKYQKQQVAGSSLKTFIVDFNKAYPNISHDGNLGLLKFCDPFGSGQGQSTLPSSSKCLDTCTGGKRCQKKVCGQTEKQQSDSNIHSQQRVANNMKDTERCQKGTVAGSSCDGMSFFAKQNRHTPSCSTCHGIPWFPNFCKADNPAWRQKGGYNAGNNCAWVALKPRDRCTKAGANGKLAFEDCMGACYNCKSTPANLYSAGASAEGCVVADLIDDNVLMERFSEIAIAFFASSIVNSEVRMFQQRYHMVFKTTNTAELTRKFSSYLQKHKSKLPMDQVKAWIDNRYQTKLIKAKQAEIEAVLNVTLAGTTQAIISTDGLQKFAVKSVILCLQFLEMALLDTKVHILGVQYEVIATEGEAGHQQKSIENLMKTATTSPIDVDWTFVDKFVDDWYTKNHDSAMPRARTQVNSFFEIDVGFLVPLEKLICKLSFGAAMDVVNANFRQMELPLPLVHANKGLHLVENHPDSTAQIPVPKTKMSVSTRVKTGDWFRTFLPILTAGVNGSMRNSGDVIGSLDPVRSIRSDPTAVERRIESINARSTCGYVLKNLAGLGSLEFDNVEVTADFPWGAGMNCKVCIQTQACGNNCVPKNLTCRITTGCAVNGDAMGTDLEFSGRFLRNKQIGMYSRVCTGGKACGNSCIDSKKNCALSPGSACNADEVICRVCTGGRKACDDKCVPAGATCTARNVGCARNVADFADIDLNSHSTSTGKFSFKAAELSVQAEVTAKADSCGTATGTDGCCLGEEKFPQGAGAKCYASCNKTTGGLQPNRLNPCTCQMKDACTSNEEQHQGMCYKKCSALTAGSHSVRSGPNTCKMVRRCQLNEEEFRGMCYKRCSLLTGGDQPIRHNTHTCRKAVKCNRGEEIHGGKCYKKCSTLTGFSHPVRAGPNTCRKARKCANNEEEFERRCYKKCSVLTRGERPHRLSAYTCSPSPDQIEARLTAAGAGRGEIGVTLSWDTKDDLDIYVQPPGHRKIFYGRKRSAGGTLDIDANAGSRRRYSNRPIENVFWPPLVNQRGPPRGEYKVWFKVYRSRTRRRGAINWQANVKVAGQSNRYNGRLEGNLRRRNSNRQIRRRPTYFLGRHDVSGRTYSGPAANPPIWEAESSGSGCSGYGVSGSGSCAKPFYHVWTKGRGCSGFRVASDGGCPNNFYDRRTSGNDCGGYGVAADGGCPNKPYDSWTKGRGCSGFGIAGNLACAVPLYHPTTNCAKFGVAANGGLAHLPFIAPKTLVTNSKLQNFKGAASFAAVLNPTTLNLASLQVTHFEATWDDLAFRLPELGVFSVHAEAIRTAMSDGLENHMKSLLANQISWKLSSVCQTQRPVINQKIDFSKCLREVRNRDLHTGGRRLAQSDIHPGHIYTVSETGHVEPKSEQDHNFKCAASEDEDEDEEEDAVVHNCRAPEDEDEEEDGAAARALGADSIQMASVQVELIAHGVAYNKLGNHEVVALADAMQTATANFAGVAETDIISVPKLENDFETTRVSTQIFVVSSEKDALIAKFRQFQGKAFESEMEGAIKHLDLGVAKSDLVVVSTEKIVDGDKTISFTEVESQDTSIFT